MFVKAFILLLVTTLNVIGLPQSGNGNNAQFKDSNKCKDAVTCPVALDACKAGQAYENLLQQCISAHLSGKLPPFNPPVVL